MSESTSQSDRPDVNCAETARLRATITRLQSELSSRQADSRPLPSSVMRAYQALIDKNFAKLAELERHKPLF